MRRDDALLRNVEGLMNDFNRLRKYYQERREWSSLRVQCHDSASAELLLEPGFNVL